MKLTLHRADHFNADFDRQHRWYLEQAGEELAERFLKAGENTVQALLKRPDWGRRRDFVIPRWRAFGRFKCRRRFKKS